MFLFILVLGKIFVRPDVTAPAGADVKDIAVMTDDYEDYLVFSDMDVYLSDAGIEPDELSDEDIIEYLIYIGATEKYIESNNE